MKSIFNTCHACLTNRNFVREMSLAVFFMAVSLFINFYAGIYATEKASSPVTDIVLSNTPIFRLSGIFLYGPVVFWIAIILLELKHLELFPFGFKAISLFILIRAGFITLTHIGPFLGSHPVDLTGVMGNFTFGYDLFFSAHTGLPFLMALVFWRDQMIRYFCIASSVFFGIVVLLAHLHYTIDVVAAFFITYSIYKIATIIFKKDFEMLIWKKA